MAEDTTDFHLQRRVGMGAIAVGVGVAIVLWLAITRYAPPLAGMETLAARMLFTLKVWALAILFCLVGGVEAIAHERLVSPAFDPLAGFETRRLRVNKQYLQNTLEQSVVFTAAIFGLAAYCPSGAAMRSVVAAALIWVVGRFAFWIGYHRSAALRGLGAPSMALSMLVLLYVAWRFGDEQAGPVGGVFLVAAFLALEGVLVWAVRPRGPARA